MRVLSGLDLAPLAGIPVRLMAALYDPIRGAGAETESARGETDRSGAWVGQVQALPPGSRIVARADPPGAPSVSQNVVPGGDREVTLVACPGGTPALVCEVAERRAYFQDQLRVQETAWHNAGAFAVDQAHAAMESFVPRQSALARRWAGELSWAVTDPGIPPADFPAMIPRYEEALAIFHAIPFPSVSGTDWFRRCAWGTPVWRSRTGEPLSLADFRIYSDTHSDFFPRSARKIRVELAAKYLLNIARIVDCIDHKFGKRLREVERTARAMSTMGLVTAFVLGPMAGAPGVGNAVTELATYAYRNLGRERSAVEAGSGTLVDGVLAGTEPGIDLLIAAGLTTTVAALARDADPRVARIAQEAIPRAVSYVAGDAQRGLLSGGAQDVGTLQGLGSTAMVFAIRLLVGSMNAVAARKAEDFKEIALGMRDLPDDVVVFLVWCIDQLLLESLFDAAEDLAGQEETPPGEPPPEGPPGRPADALSIDPATGGVLVGGRPAPLALDPETGFVFDPGSRAIIDPASGKPTGAFLSEDGRAVDAQGLEIPRETADLWRLPGTGARLSGLGAAAGGALVLAGLAAVGIMSS